MHLLVEFGAEVVVFRSDADGVTASLSRDDSGAIRADCLWVFGVALHRGDVPPLSAVLADGEQHGGVFECFEGVAGGGHDEEVSGGPFPSVIARA